MKNPELIALTADGVMSVDGEPFPWATYNVRAEVDPDTVGVVVTLELRCSKVDLSALEWRGRVDTSGRVRLEEPSAGAL